MRVGVYVGAHAPSTGGGYTFVRQVVSELERRGGAAAHPITLIGHAPFERTSLDTLVLAQPTHRRSRARRRALRLLQRVGARWGRAAPPNEATGLRERFDVLWHLVPCVALEPDIPYITIVWDLQHRLQPYFPEVSAAGQFASRHEAYTRVLSRAALVIAGTQAGQREIARFYGIADERMRVLAHPTPADAVRAAGEPPMPRPGWMPRDPYLFYPAQLWAHKNHVTLIDALALLRKHEGTNLQLVLTGSDQGNLDHVMAHARAVGVADAVVHLGLVARERVLELYRHAEALTYVSHFGPENLPPLEAFALGCPVVAADVSGAREQLADAAQLVDPYSAGEIAAAVMRLRQDPDLRSALIACGRERALRFTVGDFVDGVARWLDEFEAVRRCWPTA